MYLLVLFLAFVGYGLAAALVVLLRRDAFIRTLESLYSEVLGAPPPRPSRLAALDRQLLAATAVATRCVRRLYVHYFVRINRNAKCRGCGHRQGYLKFEGGLVRHNCTICGAVWYVKPLVDPQFWLPKTGA